MAVMNNPLKTSTPERCCQSHAALRSPQKGDGQKRSAQRCGKSSRRREQVRVHGTAKAGGKQQKG
jgi:hypothetical protein